MNPKIVTDLASKLDGVSVKDHFGSDGYSAHKRMFMTVWSDGVNMRLDPESQRRFLSLDGEGFTEIENGWGHQGWTRVNLEFVERGDFEEALRAAWEYSKIKSERPKGSIVKKSASGKKMLKTGAKISNRKKTKTTKKKAVRK